MRAPYVVMAAGPRAGELRRQLGVGFPGQSYDDRFLICDIRAELPRWERERRFYFDPSWNPGRQVLIHPTPGSVFRIDWQVPDDVDLDEEERSRPARRTDPGHHRAGCRLCDRLEVALHLPRPSGRAHEGRAGLAGGRLCPPRGAVWGQGAELRRPRRRERGLEAGLRPAGVGPRGLAPDLRHRAHGRGRARTSRSPRPPCDSSCPRTRRNAPIASTCSSAPAAIPRRGAQVDSGRMYEPFWYVDSPLTTPNPAGRSPVDRLGDRCPRRCRGSSCRTRRSPIQSTPQASRLRAIARDGLLVLVADDVAADDVQAFAAGLTAVPVRTVALGTLTPDGRLAAILGAEPGEAWVIRPDCHIAAVVPAADRATLAGAIRRVLALPAPVSAS